METMKTKAAEKAGEDYEKNFMPRKQILSRLTFEEVKEILTDEELLNSVQHVAWHFKFYLKQLIYLSIKKCVAENEILSDEERKEHINELIALVEFSSYNVARAFVAMVRIKLYPDTITTFQLADMFSGTSIYDDYVAQEAYHLYHWRDK